MADTVSANEVLSGDAALRYIEATLGYPLEELLAFPKYLLIETVNACNARCVMCGIDFGKKSRGIMPDALFDKIANEIAEYRDHVEKVMLYLDGEPLLDRKLPARIAKMKAGGVKKVNIATNASLLDAERAYKIINAGLDEIYITLDSLDKATFEAIRRGLKFETVYENIVEFIGIRDRLNPDFMIRIQMILQQSNRHEAEAFAEHWTPLLQPNDQVVVQKAHNWGSTVETMSFGDEASINKVPCIALWGTLCIHADGRVGLCCMDSDNIWPLGHVGAQSIAEIWSGSPMQRMRKKHITGRRSEFGLCNGCTVWREAKHDKEQLIERGL